MKIVQAEFIASAVHAEQYPPESLAEIAFAGRSNVGKSSLINSLANIRRLAKTSKSPGRTITINFFKINQGFYFVDLPGFGFAKVPYHVRQSWQKMMEEYFQSSQGLRLLLHLVDSRIPPTKHDILFHQWLEAGQIPYAIIMTKTDKISRNQRAMQKKAIQKAFQCPKEIAVFGYSAKTGDGKEALLEFIGGCI